MPYLNWFPDCPMYALLQDLHLSLYIPLGFTLVGFSVNCWYVVFVARRAMYRLVCLKWLVTFLINGLWYVKVTHFLFCCVVVVSCFCFCFLISFSFRLCMMCMENPLFWAILIMFFHSCCFDCFVIGNVNILLL